MLGFGGLDIRERKRKIERGKKRKKGRERERKRERFLPSIAISHHHYLLLVVELTSFRMCACGICVLIDVHTSTLNILFVIEHFGSFGGVILCK